MPSTRAADASNAALASALASGTGAQIDTPRTQMGDGPAVRLSGATFVSYALRVEQITIWVDVGAELFEHAALADLDELAHRVAAAQEARVRAVLRITPLSTLPVPPKIEPDTAALARAAERAYNIIELSPLPDAPEVRPTAININGQIVGTASAREGSNLGYAVLWDASGGVRDLGTLGGLTAASAINDAGIVVGTSLLADSRYQHAYVWDGQAIHDLGEPGHNSIAYGINANEQVVGSLDYDAVMWDSGEAQRLATFETGLSYAVAINDVEQVLLTHWREEGTEAYLWEQGPLVDLGSFDATALNNSGQVVGHGGTPLPHAWVWQDGTMYNLGDLGGEATLGAPYPEAINDLAQVVGQTRTVDADRAFIWDGGVMSDLNDLIPADSGWVLSNAVAINNAGQIVGYGHLHGQRRAFLLNPV